MQDKKCAQSTLSEITRKICQIASLFQADEACLFARLSSLTKTGSLVPCIIFMEGNYDLYRIYMRPYSAEKYKFF